MATKVTKKRKKSLEHRYAVYHKTRGFIGYRLAYNIAVVRNKYPADRGFSVYRRR